MHPGFEPRWNLRVFFQINILVSPFSMWLGGHVNGGLVEFRLKPLSVSTLILSRTTLLSSEKGTWRFGKAPDCLTSYACAPGSNPAHPAWDQRNILRNILVSPFSMWLEVTSMAASSSKSWNQCIDVNFVQVHALRAPSPLLSSYASTGFGVISRWSNPLCNLLTTSYVLLKTGGYLCLHIHAT